MKFLNYLMLIFLCIVLIVFIISLLVFGAEIVLEVYGIIRDEIERRKL